MPRDLKNPLAQVAPRDLQTQNVTMMIEYGAIRFALARIIEFSQKAVRSEDDVDTLYTHVRLTVQGVLNFDTLNFFQDAVIPEQDDFTQQNYPSPGANNGSLGYVIELFRRYMLQPRRRLRLQIDDYPTLVSPPPTDATKDMRGDLRLLSLCPCDARMGPQPLSCDVFEFHGIRTCMVRFTVETWLPYGYDQDKGIGIPAGTAYSAILSHRWEVSTDLDPDYMTTRTVQGRIIFNGAKMFTQNQDGSFSIKYSPDDWRKYLFHPLPDNFRRDSVQLIIASDGLSARYTLIDREQPTVVPRQSAITRIAGIWKSGHYKEDITSFYRLYVNILIRVWGNRHSRRQDLINACLWSVTSFKFDKPFTPAGNYKSDLTVDLVGRYAELNVGAFVTGNFANRAKGPFLPVDGIVDGIVNNFPENIADVAIGDTTQNVQSKGPPFQNMARGTYYGRLLAQVITPATFRPKAAPAEQNFGAAAGQVSSAT